MPTNGALLRGDDGSLYFVPPDVLEGCRLEGDHLDAVEQAIAAEPEVEGFANPSVLLPLIIGPNVGQLIGAAIGPGGGGVEEDAEQLKKMVGSDELGAAGGYLQPRRRRF